MKLFEQIKSIEPNRQNLWTLNFPDEFDLPEYCINKVSKLKHYGNGQWKPLTITLLDIIGVGATKKLMENFVHIPLKVQLKKLDPTGACHETINIFSSSYDINFGNFNYASDKLSKIKIILTPKRVMVS